MDYTQKLDDTCVLGSIGPDRDAYGNAVAESFVDIFKTELIADALGRPLALASTFVRSCGQQTSACTMPSAIARREKPRISTLRSPGQPHPRDQNGNLIRSPWNPRRRLKGEVGMRSSLRPETIDWASLRASRPEGDTRGTKAPRICFSDGDLGDYRSTMTIGVIAAQLCRSLWWDGIRQ